MSIEQALAELTAAVKENTEALKEVIAGRSKVLEAAGAVTERAASTKKTSKAKAASKEADAPDEEAVRKAFGSFLKVDDEDEREARKAHVVSILGKFGAKKATDLKEKDRAEAIAALDDFSYEPADEEDEELV